MKKIRDLINWIIMTAGSIKGKLWIKGSRYKVCLGVFWVVTILCIFVISTIVKDNYHIVWSKGSTIATIIYGLTFYGYNLFSKERGSEKFGYALVGIFLFLSIIILLVSVELIDKKKAPQLYVLCEQYSFIILCLMFTIIDGILYLRDKKKYQDEFKFLMLVDIPTMVAFGVIISFQLLSSVSDVDKLKHFIIGANAFQLIAFNTAFTLLLIILPGLDKNLHMPKKKLRRS